MIYRVTKNGQHVADWQLYSGHIPLDALPYLPEEFGKRVGVCGMTFERIK